MEDLKCKIASVEAKVVAMNEELVHMQEIFKETAPRQAATQGGTSSHVDSSQLWWFCCLCDGRLFGGLFVSNTESFFSPCSLLLPHCCVFIDVSSLLLLHGFVSSFRRGSRKHGGRVPTAKRSFDAKIHQSHGGKRQSLRECGTNGNSRKRTGAGKKSNDGECS